MITSNWSKFACFNMHFSLQIANHHNYLWRKDVGIPEFVVFNVLYSLLIRLVNDGSVKSQLLFQWQCMHRHATDFYNYWNERYIIDIISTKRNVLQSAPLDFSETIALLYVLILIMDFSVMKRVLAQFHPVIMPMDVRPPPYHQQVGTIMVLWWNLFPFLNYMLH